MLHSQKNFFMPNQAHNPRRVLDIFTSTQHVAREFSRYSNVITVNENEKRGRWENIW